MWNNSIYRISFYPPYKKQTDQTAKSEKQKAFFVGNLFLRLGKSKIRLFALERLNRVLNNHTEQDYKPM